MTSRRLRILLALLLVASVAPSAAASARQKDVDAAFHADWKIELRDGTQVVGSAVAKEDVLEAQVGPLCLVVVWEDLDRNGAPDPGRFTSFLTNSQAGRGKVYWSSLLLRVEDQPVLQLGRGVLPPRYCLARTALTFADLARIPETANAPPALRQRGLEEIAKARSEWVGPYRFFIPAVDGGADKTGPGGRATAPFHGGRRDWARRFHEGLWYRIHEALGAVSRGIWLQEADGSPWLPGPNGVRYWWDASALEYAAQWEQWNDRPGWSWSAANDNWVPYEKTLANRPLSNFEHAGRWYKAVAAVAQDLRFGTWLLVNVCWPEAERSYSMDPRVPPTKDADHILYNPLWYLIERTRKAPRVKGIDRREAHAIELFTEAAPFLPEETVELYAKGWAQFIANVADDRGIVDHSRTGDAASAGLPGDVTMWFQNAMEIVAFRRLAELPGASSAGEVADRLATWWGANPPYYASTSGDFASALEAPHKGTGTPQYVWCVNPTLAPPFQKALANTIRQNWGEPDLDYYPAAW